ncbi:unnamed protein product, partial [marine sediment metagenome]
VDKLASRLGKKTKDCSAVSYMSEIKKTGNNAFTVQERLTFSKRMKAENSKKKRFLQT